MRRRGHALLLTLIALIALSSLAAVIWNRLSLERADRLTQERRLQALWLVRSAAMAGRPGSRVAQIGKDRVKINTKVYRVPGGSSVSSDIELPGFGAAKVDATLDAAGVPTTWAESFERASSSQR